MTKQLAIVFGGDSIASTDGSWTYQSLGLATYRSNYLSPVTQSSITYLNGDGSIIARNMAVPATRLNTNGFPDLVPLAPGYIDVVVVNKADIPASVATRKYLFANAIGSNDGATGGLGSVSAFAAANAAATVARKTAGFDLGAMVTLLPRNDGSLADVDRTAYNALLTDASWRVANGIDYVIDIASEATMGNPATCTNVTYFVDGTHPTPVGFALLAPIAAAVWTAVLATF